MSIVRAVTILCDGPDCDWSYPMTNFEPGTAADHRREARADGWLVSAPGGKDYCPEHRSEATLSDGGGS